MSLWQLRQWKSVSLAGHRAATLPGYILDALEHICDKEVCRLHR